MGYADVEFGGIWSSSMQIFSTGYPTIPSSAEKLTETDVPGKDGKLQKGSGTYDSTEITVEFNYIGKESSWNQKWREVKKWFSQRNTTLKFADDTDYFFKISHVKVSENQRTSRRIGKFSAVFVTKDGLSYLTDGTEKKEISEVLENPGITAHPDYYIEGNGTCVLTVNGNEMTVNVSGNIIINTDLMISYQEDNTNQNIAVSGEYEGLYLQPGLNEISVTDGFSCQVVPNWRCL